VVIRAFPTQLCEQCIHDKTFVFRTAPTPNAVLECFTTHRPQTDKFVYATLPFPLNPSQWESGQGYKVGRCGIPSIFKTTYRSASPMLLLQMISLSKYDVSRDLSYYLLSLPTRPQEGDILVWVRGIEPPTSRFQGEHSNQAELHPDVFLFVCEVILDYQLVNVSEGFTGPARADGSNFFGDASKVVCDHVVLVSASHLGHTVGDLSELSTVDLHEGFLSFLTLSIYTDSTGMSTVIFLAEAGEHDSHAISSTICLAGSPSNLAGSHLRIGTRSETRTHTIQVLNLLPLPLGYSGNIWRIEEESNPIGFPMNRFPGGLPHQLGDSIQRFRITV
jgi:hypothetical protein